MTDKPYARLESLSQSQQNLVSDIIGAFENDVIAEINPASDICTPKFAEDFQNRLVLYHAMNEDVLNKKTFEYALRGACRFHGSIANIDNNPTNPGTDIEINGVAFSLKTEAAKTISRNTLTISKLMEARWIRECHGGEDFLRGVQQHIVTHLQQYQRMLMLRAFVISDRVFEYVLVEIPIVVLLKIDHLTAADFSARTPNGSTRADIRISGHKAFSLSLDGSVEKVTIRSLDLRLCQVHARWRIPVKPA